MGIFKAIIESIKNKIEDDLIENVKANKIISVDIKGKKVKKFRCDKGFKLVAGKEGQKPTCKKITTADKLQAKKDYKKNKVKQAQNRKTAQYKRTVKKHKKFKKRLGL